MSRLTPLSLSLAQKFVGTYHRHNKPPQGHKFSIGLVAHHELFDSEMLVGVVVVGRPVARYLDDGQTVEVTRLCVLDGAPHSSCSRLYRAAWRAWREMGGRKIITYTLESESGASLRGAGWKIDANLPAKSAGGWQTRDGRAYQSVVGEAKIRWSCDCR